LASYLLHSATNPTIEEISMKHLNQVLVLPNEDENAVAQQALAVYRAWPVLQAELQEQGMGDLFYSLELPLSSVLAGMELAGVKLDVSQLDAMSSEFGRQLGRLTNEIYDLAGQSFNINSPRQLGVILFEKMKLPVVKKTKTGYSTDAAVLEELALYHEIAAKLLEYRQLLKLKSTYIDGLRALGLATGKVHTTYNQTITATGRLSSTEPNLQNIPIRMELGRKIRRAFVPSEPDWLIMAADYSQIELRILAHMSGDEKLLEAFSRGEDIHARTASEVFGVPQDEITPDLRHRAKGVNFGIVYGITDFGLARDIGVSREEAAVYIENYFRQYPDVRRFIQETIAAARDRGWVETLFKRRRYLPDLLSGNRQIRSFGERTAVNTPIQGTAADIIKLAMLRIDQSLRERGLLARMLLQVHDELVFEFPKQEQRELINLVREGMERAVELDVPLDVDIEIGPNWYDLRRVNGNA
jgi:DNA polymerase-1